MAVDARSVGLSRETFAQWLDEYKGDPDLSELRDYIETRLEASKLGDTMVDTAYRDDISSDECALINLIMDDLPSYDAYARIFA